MLNEVQISIGRELEALAQQLDISPTDYDRAVSSYMAVAKWLEDGYEAEAYEGSLAKPAIYPQGSIRLGTVVRPLRNCKDGAYDIDLVCQLQIGQIAFSPEEAHVIKNQVGDRLKANETYRQKLAKEGRRCWTVEYAKDAGVGFHIDILPAVPNEPQARAIEEQYRNYRYAMRDFASSAIAITDREKDLYRWCSSNPLGFALWFAALNTGHSKYAVRQKRVLFENAVSPVTKRRIYASIEAVPDELVRTPLQRAIQILKRHRDIQFKDDPEFKPISMIVTTLAAWLYEGEDEVYSAVANIVRKLGYHSALLRDPSARLHESVRDKGLIRRAGSGGWYIPNPVDPGENFADRWHEDGHARARAFFHWVGTLEHLLELLNAESSKTRRASLVREALGEGNAGTIASAGSAAVAPHIVITQPLKPWGRNGRH